MQSPCTVLYIATMYQGTPPYWFQIMDSVIIPLWTRFTLRVNSPMQDYLFRAKRGLYSGLIEVSMASLRVSKTLFLVGTRTLALSIGASVSDIRGLQIYSLAGLDSPCWSMFADLKTSLFLATTQGRSQGGAQGAFAPPLFFQH